MDYKEKLRAFNGTEKYRKEMLFVRRNINPYYNYDVLDYGCGIGTFMNEFWTDGFDVNNYYTEQPTPKKSHFYLNELPDKKYSDITMIHSIAHIPNPIEVLKDLKARYSATITVITPNRYWLMQQSNRDYKPDPTVHKHYTLHELKELFKEAGYEVTLIGQFGELNNGVNERIFLQAR